MKILLVEDDAALLWFLAKELEARGYEVLQTDTGDGGLYFYKKDGPFEFVLSDYSFIPGTKIKDGVQLVTAIHEINPLQRMAMMTAEPKKARGKLPNALRDLPVLRKPFNLEQLLRVAGARPAALILTHSRVIRCATAVSFARIVLKSGTTTKRNRTGRAT